MISIETHKLQKSPVIVIAWGLLWLFTYKWHDMDTPCILSVRPWAVWDRGGYTCMQNCSSFRDVSLFLEMRGSCPMLFRWINHFNINFCVIFLSNQLHNYIWKKRFTYTNFRKNIVHTIRQKVWVYMLIAKTVLYRYRDLSSHWNYGNHCNWFHLNISNKRQTTQIGWDYLKGIKSHNNKTTRVISRQWN